MSENKQPIGGVYAGASGHVNVPGCGILSGLSSRPNKCPMIPPCKPTNPCNACGGGSHPQQYQNQIGEEMISQEASNQPIEYGYGGPAQYNQYQFQHQQPESKVMIIKDKNPHQQMSVSLTHPENRKTVDLYVSAEGSLEDLASNEEARVVGVNPAAFHNAARGGQSAKRVLPLSITLLSASSSFPVDVSVSVHKNNPCDKYDDSHIYGADGAKHGVILYAKHTDGHSRDEVFFKPDKSIDDLVKFQEYNGVTSEMLGKKISTIDGESHSLVEDSHPMINLLRANGEKIGVNIDDLEKAWGKYYAIDNGLIKECNEHIENNIIAKFPYRDMNSFNFVLGRPDGEEWNSPANLKNVGDRSVSRVIDNVLAIKNQVSMVVRVVYVYAPTN